MTVPAENPDPLPYDADIASAAALIADSTRAVILRALLPDRPLSPGQAARGRADHRHQAGPAPLLPAGRARGRGGAGGPRPDQPRPAGAQPAPVARGGRAGRGQDVLRPPGRAGGGGGAGRPAPPWPARREIRPNGPG